MAKAYEVIGECGFDNIVNEVGTIPVITTLRKVKAGQGVLKAGAILATDSNGELVHLSASSQVACYVLKEAVDTGSGSAVNAVVYCSGHFNKNHLTAKSGYTATAKDYENLRNAGIFTAISME